MNKIFKIIWSKTLNQLVVTSELSRGESKASSTETAQKERSSKGLSLKATYSTIALLVAAALPTAAMAGRAEHGGAIGNTNTNANTIAIGNASYARGSSAVAIGGGKANPDNADVNRVGTIALGWSTAQGDSAIAQGTSNAVGESAIALGGLAQAYGTSAVAFGKGARVGSPKQTANGSSGDVNGGIAIGQDARVAGDQAAYQPVKNAIAIGTGAQAWSNNSVALGAGSVAGYTPNAPLSAGGTGLVKDTIKNNLGGTANAQNLEQALGITKGVGEHDFAGVVTADESGQYSNVVSVGRGKGNNESTQPLYRQIINVGAGRITADSTDAINGSQLYQVLKYLKDKNIVSVNEKGEDTTNTNGGGAGGGASAFTIKTANNQTATGNADNTIDSTKNQITFGATSDLTVNSEDGKVVYGISDTFKNTMNEAVSKAETAATQAASSASAADSSASAASTSASAADSSASAASTSASAADSSASAASTSASAADSSASAASTSASAADSSASAASTSASAADSSASAASTSASAADSSASAASTSASAADSSASAAS
ncbi:ESPR-type extended signal peptide-containing protein, partial [Avibacterium avium]|uniref:ESPR-type extended signal peptide-containing protein n=1 Tax=Avibacterium avium TaxID=751 RepID=UPI003BF86EA7